MGYQKITTVIIDDESHSAQLLNKLLSPFSLFGNVAVYTNPSEGFNEVIALQPKYIFLDIEMPGITGIQLSEKIKSMVPNARIIFVTAFEQYALEALRQNAFDYLLKPVDRSELIRVVEKLHTDQKSSKSDKQNKHLLVRGKDGIYPVHEDDIVYLEADCSYTTIILKTQQNLLWSANLGKIMPMLPANKFVRISRKHVVNRSYINFYHTKQKYLTLKATNTEYKLNVQLKVQDIKDLLTS